VCFRRGFHQGAYEVLRLLEAGGWIEDFHQWESEISCWRLDGERAAMEGRTVDRLIPPYWQKRR
jgi:hypothetical protein